MHTNVVEIFLWRDLAIFFLIGSLLGVALGLLLIFRPHLLGRINHVASRWVSTRYIERLLDRIISIDYWFYRHHRPLGILVILGAGYILLYFGFLFDKAIDLQLLPHYVPVKLQEGLLDALVITALIGAAIALFAGFSLWLRPSLLHGVEEEANRWVSSRQGTKVLEVSRDKVDRFVMRHERPVGWLLLVGSIYLFFAMFYFLV